jgi:peptidoglycan/LPS O-acetylase OafA/YrhL
LERTGRVRPPGWLCRIGDASYSIYLTHWSIAVVVLDRTRWWPHTPLGHPLWVAAVLAAMVGGGYLCYLGVERPLLNLARRRRPSAERRPDVGERPARAA